MRDPTEPRIRAIRYRCTTAGHETREFLLRLDASSLALLPTMLPESPPELQAPQAAS
jgi:hypothetical protein